MLNPLMPKLLPSEEDEALREDREVFKLELELELLLLERRRRAAFPILDFTINRLSSGRPKCFAVAAGSRCCPSAMCSTKSVSISGLTIQTPPLADCLPSSGFWKNLFKERTCRTEFLQVLRAVLKKGKFS